MCQNHKISLGFTDQKFDQGAHICQIYSEDKEREEALNQYLLSGLKDGEKVACFSEKVKKEELKKFLKENDISMEDNQQSGALGINGTSEIYFQDNKFDSNRMLSLLTKFYNDSVDEGHSAARVIGEMIPEIKEKGSHEELLTYESKVTMLQQKYPVTAVCQYNAREFDGDTLMEILKVHPYMIVKGSVVHNPFYISPDEYLTQKQ